MLPTSKTDDRSTARRAPAALAPKGEPARQRPGAGPRDPLRPIGPERLRELREAIRNGTYPTEADVLGGLQRLLGRDS